MNYRKLLLLLLTIVSFTTYTKAQVLAFPGAEGFGRYAQGARTSSSPTIYHVTNLNDSGTGSLRDAVSQPNRFVVFDVAGVIKISDRLIFSSNITVAGQTAPGDGVVVYGNGVSFSGAKNVIVRHMRFRMGLGGDSGKDAAGVANGSDMIFDHCSFTWGRDETFSISWDNKGTEPANITIQNSIIGQGIMTHSAGGLIQTDGGVTLYKNLYADNKTRNPKVKGLNQYVNNVVYNWGSGGGYILGDSEGSSWAVIENSYFIKGPDTGGTEAFVRANANFQLFQSGNYLDYSTDAVLNGRLAQESDYGAATFVSDYSGFSGSPKTHPVIENKLTAEASYYWIVDSVGPVLPSRDMVDSYIINELTSLGTVGALINGEADLALPGTVGYVFSANKLVDSDNDGIPDTWEDANGLNKNDASDALILNGDYYNIEHYINSINAGTPFVKYPTKLIVTGVDTHFINFKWDNNAVESTNIIVEISTDQINYSPIATLSPESVNYKIEGIQSNTTYYIRLKTINGSSESLYSEVLKSATLGEPIVPLVSVNPVPANESVVKEYSKVTLSWENTTGVWGGNLYYSVFVGESAESMEKVADAITGTNKEILLSPQTTYFWRVDVTNLLGTTAGDVWKFTSGVPIERTKLAYWSFDEESGTQAANLVYGYADAKSFTPVWEAGKLNNCVTFSGDATAAFVQPHYNQIALGNESFSVELWFKSPGGTGSTTDYYLIHKGSHTKNESTGATGKWFGIQYQKKSGTDRLTWAIDDDVTKTAVDIASGSSYFNNVWTHLLCVRDVENKLLQVYINGVLKGSTTDKTGNIAQEEDMVIGNTNVSFVNGIIGSMDEVSIYEGAMSAEEVFDKFSKYSTGLDSPIAEKNNYLLHYYPNPFKDIITIDMTAVSQEVISAQVFSLSGTLLKRPNVLSSNEHVTISGLDDLSSGVYFCQLRLQNGENVMLKIMK